MHFNEFSDINRRRCESPDAFNHSLNGWDKNKWMVALTGELGEAANIMKKMNRLSDGIDVNKDADKNYIELIKKLRDELADTFIYLDLLCQSMGINLEQAVIDKFNEKSNELNAHEYIIVRGENVS